MTDNRNLKIKKMSIYVEDDYQTAYAKARRELGPNLIIMEKKDIKVGGFMGIMAKNKVKVTYGVEDVALNNKSIKSKNDNKDIMELLEKMGFDSKKGETKSGNRSILEDEGVKVETGTKPAKEIKQETKPEKTEEVIKVTLSSDLRPQIKEYIVTGKQIGRASCRERG